MLPSKVELMEKIVHVTDLMALFNVLLSPGSCLDNESSISLEVFQIKSSYAGVIN